MTDLMKTVLALSLSGTALAGALALVRRLLKNKLPQALFYYLWLLVLLRLIVPVAVQMPEGLRVHQMEAVVAPVQQVQINPEWSASVQQAQNQLPPGTADQQWELVVPSGTVPSTALTPQLPSEPWYEQLWDFICDHFTALWLGGALVHFLWFALSYLRFCRSLKESCTPLWEHEQALLDVLRKETPVTACRSTLAGTPMLVGLMRPQIILPDAEISTRQLEYILRHELTHLRRRDLLYKWFAVAASSFHWFNPFMPWLRKEISRCCELSCDEAVIGTLSEEQKQQYGETLLALAALHALPRAVPATTLCEEKQQLRERLLGIMRYQKATALILLLSCLLAVLIAGCAAVLGPQKPVVETRDMPMEEDPAVEDSVAEESDASSVAIWLENEYPDHTVLSSWSDDAVTVLLAGITNPGAEGYQILKAYIIENGDSPAILAEKSGEPNISVGFSAHILTAEGRTILFGDTADSIFDYQNDARIDMNFTSVQVIQADKQSENHPITGNSPYLVVMDGEKQIESVIFLSNKGGFRYSDFYSQPLYPFAGKVAVITQDAPLENAFVETVDENGNTILMDMALTLQKGTLVYVEGHEDNICTVTVLAGEPPHPRGQLPESVLSTDPELLMQANQVILHNAPQWSGPNERTFAGLALAVSGVANVEERRDDWLCVTLPGGGAAFWVRQVDLSWEWPLPDTGSLPAGKDFVYENVHMGFRMAFPVSWGDDFHIEERENSVEIEASWGGTLCSVFRREVTAFDAALIPVPYRVLGQNDRYIWLMYFASDVQYDPGNAEQTATYLAMYEDLQNVPFEIMDSGESDLWAKTAAWLEQEFRRVYDPYYDIQDLQISNWQENGNEATFHYTMNWLNYNRDPDTVAYIQEAKAKSQSSYETLYQDYLALKTSNYFFKIRWEGDTPTLYSDVSVKGEPEWVETTVDDYILK